MYCGHVRLCVCLSAAVRQHYCTDSDVTPYMASGHGWLAGDWPSTGGVLNITAAAWTADFHWWCSGDITRRQNISEYMRVLALCLVIIVTAFATELAIADWV